MVVRPPSSPTRPTRGWRAWWSRPRPPRHLPSLAAYRLAVPFCPAHLLLAGAARAFSRRPGARGRWCRAPSRPRARCCLPLRSRRLSPGPSRAARIGVVIKAVARSRRLAAGRVILSDKTGTLTQGRLVLTMWSWRVKGGPTVSPRKVAASLDQVSPDAPASSIVTAARSWLDPGAAPRRRRGARSRAARPGSARTRSGWARHPGSCPGQPVAGGCSCAGGRVLDDSLTVFCCGRRGSLPARLPSNSGTGASVPRHCGWSVDSGMRGSERCVW